MQAGAIRPEGICGDYSAESVRAKHRQVQYICIYMYMYEYIYIYRSEHFLVMVQSGIK